LSIVTLGVVAGILAGAVAGVVGAVAGAGLGLVFWAAEQKGALFDIRTAASPSALLAQDRKAGTARGAMGGMLTGLFGVILVGSHGIVAAVVTGIIAWAMGGAVLSAMDAAWPSYETAQLWLALRHRLPWSLMGFLADAHGRDVLRQVGAVYQFRHIELQHRLATRPTNSVGVPEAPDAGAATAPETLP